MADTEAQKLIRQIKKDPPQGSKALAIRLKEVREAFTPEERNALRSKHHPLYVPELPYGRPQLCALDEILRSEEIAELEVEACWRALDSGKSIALVRHALKVAKVRLLQRPKIRFAAEIATLLAEGLTDSATPGPREKALKKGKKGCNWQKIAAVAGKDVVTIPEVIMRLRRQKWLPESRDMAAYMSQIMSVHPAVFERLERGLYKVIPGPLTADLPVPPKVVLKSKPKVSSKAAKRLKVSKNVSKRPQMVAPQPAPKPVSLPPADMPRPDPSWRQWILKRAAQLRVEPSAYLDGLIEADMQRVLSKARPRLAS